MWHFFFCCIEKCASLPPNLGTTEWLLDAVSMQVRASSPRLDPSWSSALAVPPVATVWASSLDVGSHLLNCESSTQSLPIWGNHLILFPVPALDHGRHPPTCVHCNLHNDGTRASNTLACLLASLLGCVSIRSPHIICCDTGITNNMAKRAVQLLYGCLPLLHIIDHTSS